MIGFSREWGGMLYKEGAKIKHPKAQAVRFTPETQETPE